MYQGGFELLALSALLSVRLASHFYCRATVLATYMLQDSPVVFLLFFNLMFLMQDERWELRQ